VIAAPQQQINLGINYSFKIFSLNISAQHIEKLYTSVKPIITQSYTLVNTRLTIKPTKNLDIFVSGNNLLNQKYEINYGYPMPGIYYNAGLNVRF
jgi:iron complex outermembrane receptor protein